MTQMKACVEQTHTEMEVALGTKRVAKWIVDRFGAREEPILLVGVLTGAFVFMADLIRVLSSAPFPTEAAFLKIAAARQGESTGFIRMLVPPTTPLTDRDVVFVEDLVDTGLTCCFMRQLGNDLGARSTSIVSMVDRPGPHRKHGTAADVWGIGINANDFIVGSGLDLYGKYRGLPGLWRVLPESVKAES